MFEIAEYIGIIAFVMNLSSMEYYVHKSLEMGKVFKIKFALLAIANRRILFWKDCPLLGFPLGFMRFPICLDRFF